MTDIEKRLREKDAVWCSLDGDLARCIKTDDALAIVRDERKWRSVEDELPVDRQNIFCRGTDLYGNGITKEVMDNRIKADFKTLFTHWCPRYIDTPPPFTKPSEDE